MFSSRGWTTSCMQIGCGIRPDMRDGTCTRVRSRVLSVGDAWHRSSDRREFIIRDPPGANRSSRVLAHSHRLLVSRTYWLLSANDEIILLAASMETRVPKSTGCVSRGVNRLSRWYVFSTFRERFGRIHNRVRIEEPIRLNVFGQTRRLWNF